MGEVGEEEEKRGGGKVATEWRKRRQWLTFVLVPNSPILFGTNNGC